MLLLEKVFQIINESGLDYCIQNKYEMMPEEIPSDIDMMYRNADESFLDQLVIKVAKETRLLVTQKIVQGYYEYTYILSYPIPQKRFQRGHLCGGYRRPCGSEPPGGQLQVHP